MAGKIIRFHQHKNIEFIDLIQKGKELKFDVFLKVNNFPFTLKNVMIRDIRKDKIRYYYDDIFHQFKNDDIEICPFCEKPFANSMCEVLSKEKDEIFSKINRQLFFPIMSFNFSDKDQSFFDSLAKTKIDNFEALFFGVSENTFIQCIFKYKEELLLFQDAIDPNNTEIFPLIFYFDTERHELHLYIEYLLPENLIPITSAIKKSLHKPNTQIFDTTGFGLKELYLHFKENNKNY